MSSSCARTGRRRRPMSYNAGSGRQKLSSMFIRSRLRRECSASTDCTKFLADSRDCLHDTVRSGAIVCGERIDRMEPALAVGEVEGVGVLAEGCEHLGAGSDNFSDHVLLCKP